MQRTRRSAVWTAAFLFTIASVLAIGGDAAEDPWSGKTRDEAITILGPPTKHKRGKNGETLVYKLVRLEEDAEPVPGVTVLEVPGIGVVAKVEPSAGRLDDTFAYSPTEVDEEGRPRGGTVGPTRSRTISRDLDSGETTDSGFTPGLPAGTKVTLKLEVDPAGKIRDWSVSPRKAARN